MCDCMCEENGQIVVVDIDAVETGLELTVHHSGHFAMTVKTVVPWSEIAEKLLPHMKGLLNET